MRHLRPAVVAVAAAALLGLAPEASAAFKPNFTATSTNDGAVTINYSERDSNDGPAALEIYSPAPYAALATTNGAMVGEATSHAVGADLGGSTVFLKGNIRVATPATPLTGGVTAGEQRKTCTGSDTSAALWVATLKGYLQTIKLAITVQHLTSGPMAGGIALFICPPTGAVAKGTPGRAPFGFKIVQLAIAFSDPVAAPSGTYGWHLRATPYSAGSAALDPARAVEAEAQHGTPQTLVLAAQPAAHSNLIPVSGRLTMAGAPVAGAKISIVTGKKTVGTAKTDASGAFSAAVRVEAGRTTTLLARTTVAARYHRSCAERVFASIPCVSSILDGFVAVSDPVYVRGRG